MKKNFLLLLLVALICSFHNAGCIKQLTSPTASLTITSVDPYYVSWTKVGDGASATFSLPSVKISLRNDTGIPANLQATSISYRTKLGELITQLPAYTRNQELALAPSATTNFDVAFYYSELLDFTPLTNSPIWPVKATFSLAIKDINGNKQTLEANCIIIKPDITIAAGSPTTTTTPPTTTPTPTPTLTPSLVITSPLPGPQTSRNILFQCQDTPSNSITGFRWSSIPAGVQGSTKSFNQTLTAGNYTINLSGTYSGGTVDATPVNITVPP